MRIIGGSNADTVNDSTIVALVPARAGSKRIPNKNVRLLGNKPLIAWTIEVAKESGIFSGVYVCTDSQEYGHIAAHYGAVVIKRFASLDDEPDIVWVRNALAALTCDAFAILRPTSPFRSAETIRRAWAHFLDNQPCDSLRAVEPVRQHPGKMWICQSNRLLPLLPWATERSPWHSSPTQSLPTVYVQNASLEIAWTRTVLEQGTIAGTNVVPFYTEGLEGYDLNWPEQWPEAEKIAQEVLCQ